MFQQIYEPVGNLAVSTLIAAIPIVVLFVLLAGLRMAAQWAALITLAVPRSPGLVAQVPDTLIGAGPDGRSDGSRERIETPAADLR